jgi:hypothetical protein
MAKAEPESTVDTIGTDNASGTGAQRASEPEAAQATAESEPSGRTATPPGAAETGAQSRRRAKVIAAGALAGGGALAAARRRRRARAQAAARHRRSLMPRVRRRTERDGRSTKMDMLRRRLWRR